MSTIAKLYNNGLLHCPEWLAMNTIYETVMGSEAYGANLAQKSDQDIYAVTLPPKEIMFPYLGGKIFGFDKFEPWNVWQQHHIKDTNGSQFDLSVYSITNYFLLCYENNPNMVDSLFTPIDCVRKLSKAGELMRDNRQIFLSKLCFNKFRGYAFSQMDKIKVISTDDNEVSFLDLYKTVKHSSRLARTRERVDWKFVYHVVRLLLECEQILADGDLKLRRDGAFLKQIRQGVMTLDELFVWVGKQEGYLETLHKESSLPNLPDKNAVRELLIKCIELVYEDFDTIVYIPTNEIDKALNDIRRILSEI